MPSTSRRQILAGLSAIPGAIGLTGCTSWRSKSPTQLQELSIGNREEIVHDVGVRIIVDDEVVYETERELGPNIEKGLPCEWPQEASEYTITVAVDSGETGRITLDSGDDECILASIRPDSEEPVFQNWIPCPRPPESSASEQETCY